MSQRGKGRQKLAFLLKYTSYLRSGITRQRTWTTDIVPITSAAKSASLRAQPRTRHAVGQRHQQVDRRVGEERALRDEKQVEHVLWKGSTLSLKSTPDHPHVENASTTARKTRKRSR
jgi:hypothetical protein